MNAITTTERGALALTESELLDVMESSLYPGAKVTSIKLALGYCKAAGLDPMQKPVHLVPMSVKKAGTKDYEWRDVVMPGIGLYRTQAARTGEHVGTDEPVYGPMIDLRIGDFVMQVPEWCKVTVYRMKHGVRCAFTATEYWIENYATAGKDSTMPNTMWKKRSRGQISKCAEAQALRKGFPEVGNQPTAEEMEGKAIDSEFVDAATGEINGSPPITPQRKSEKPAAEDVPFTETSRTAPPATAQGSEAKGTINAGQVKYLTQKFAAVGLEGEAIAAFITKHGATSLDTTVTVGQFDAMKAELLAAL